MGTIRHYGEKYLRLGNEVRVSLGGLADTSFGEVSVTLTTPIGIRLHQGVIVPRLEYAPPMGVKRHIEHFFSPF